MLSEFARRELREARPGRPAAVTIGVFDGVHLGHQALFRQLRALADERGLATVILAFHPSPVTVLRPDIRISYLTTLEERLELLRAQGVDQVGRLTFTSELSQVSAKDFATGLCEEVNMRLFVGGPDLSVGRAREGNLEWLKVHGPEIGFDVAVVDFVQDDGHKTGSSTIRQALMEGDVALAARLLGRPFALHGPVVEGAKRGRTIGFPTANIAVGPDLTAPAHGVYVGIAHVGANRYRAVANIGRRPTFDDGPPSIEPHLLDFSGDLYDREIRLELLARLRGEQKFSSIDELVGQIQRDVQAARDYFAVHPLD